MLTITETTAQHRIASIEADVLTFGPTSRHGRIVISGLIHTESIPQLALAVEEMLHVNPSNLVVDATGVEFDDAAGVRLIARMQAILERRGATVVIDGLRPAARQVLDAVRSFDRLATD
jgi:anti-anti-sigma regulatory factor